MRIRIYGGSVNGLINTQCVNQTYHADEKAGLLRSTPDTGVTDDANGEAGRETREADGETGAELDEALVERHFRGH